MTNFLNLHGLLFGPGVGYCAQQAAEMSAISQKKKNKPKPRKGVQWAPSFCLHPIFPMCCLSQAWRSAAWLAPSISMKSSQDSNISPGAFWTGESQKQKSNNLVFDQLLLCGFEDGPLRQGDVTILAGYLWSAACALSVLERHSPNSSPEFQARSLPAVGHSKREWEHTLHTEAGSRKLDSFVLHAPLISGTKGPPVPPAPRVGTWEAGKTELPFHWRTLWLWWVPRGDTAVAK